MRRLLIILSLLIIPLAASAQTSALEKVDEKYAGKAGYQSYVYGKRMISMMQENASSDVKKLLDRIEMIRIITHTGKDIDSLYSEALAAVRKDYELISRMDEDGGSSLFYLYDTGNKKDNMSFVMINTTTDNCVILEIIGKFDVKDISKLSAIGKR